MGIAKYSIAFAFSDKQKNQYVFANIFYGLLYNNVYI